MTIAIQDALANLNQALDNLDEAVSNRTESELAGTAGTDIDVDQLSLKLESTIEKVEKLLREG